MHLKTLTLSICLLTASGLALSDERVEHYSGEKAETLTEAIANLRDYRQELAAIVEGDDFGSERLHTVHEITYSLENALQTVNSELQKLAETLESVHLASERGETETVARDGAMFIEKTGVLLQLTEPAAQ